MDCRELEERLEALLDGELAEPERHRCLDHLAGCRRCRELTEPLAPIGPPAASGPPPAAAPPADLVGAVLARTSGPVCGRAEELLCGWADGELQGAGRELVAAHLAGCPRCRALAAALTRLTAELPRLAELRPDPGFVAAVLAATLPPGVRLRRRWAAAWPRWVRRPRFASEAAFVATMALVLVFATPGSPLEAVPNRALELARTAPAAKLEVRLEPPVAALGKRFDSHVKEPIRARYVRGEAELRSWATAAGAGGHRALTTFADWLGTSRERLASLMGSADETASRDEENATRPNQETP